MQGLVKTKMFLNAFKACGHIFASCISAYHMFFSFIYKVKTPSIGLDINPLTPKSDQCQNSPAASQEIWHHTVWRTWSFMAHSHEWSISNFSCSLNRNVTSHSLKNLAFHGFTQMKDDYTTNSHYLSYIHFSCVKLGECTSCAWEWKSEPNSMLAVAKKRRQLIRPWW